MPGGRKLPRVQSVRTRRPQHVANAADDINADGWIARAVEDQLHQDLSAATPESRRKTSLEPAAAAFFRARSGTQPMLPLSRVDATQ